MNMARCMTSACGLPLRFWGDAVQYAAYILNRAPANSNPGRVPRLKVLTGKSPQLGGIVVLGSPCAFYRGPRKKNFAQRAQLAIIVGVGEETKGYRVYLPKDRVVYAAYILNRAPANSNPGRVPRLKVLTGKSLQLGEIVVLGSPCTVYRGPRKKNFAQRAQLVIIVGVGEETKGYRVYLPKDRVVVTT
ncbi:hypothetical protein PR003_g13415 [Phytophthora rubi]|nr:hypothetical protein PR003_g13415 [Phytophthora rubi]